ncbi:MAG: nicotinate phosphoribosyltransferase [Candidatus Moranbacteria bacterium]|nr:nicotinate phosphoribosyltransferase [Candidatus Moranbacteria bacterium]
MKQMTKTETPIIRSLLDIDFYKFTMGQFIHRFYPDIETTFELINRERGIPLSRIVPESALRREFDHARTLCITDEEVRFLRETEAYGGDLFSEEYLDFLRNGLTLPPYRLERKKEQYLLRFDGPWKTVTFWETIALAIVSELYSRSIMAPLSENERGNVYAVARKRIARKLDSLAGIPDLRFADFGQRRRHSGDWQREIVRMCLERTRSQFIGTSNTLLAKEMSIPPVGTNAHELPMILTAVTEDNWKRRVQYEVTERWQALYRGKSPNLLVFLPDTYGTTQFLKHAPERLAREWKGFRQDSGDPERTAERYIGWLRKHGVNPRERLIIFSDGLNEDEMLYLHKRFSGEIGVAFGWGTLLTNDFRGIRPDLPLLRPFSLVCKATQANRRPVVKLSDNVQKATGPVFEVERYLRIFGRNGREDRTVLV